MTTLGGFFIDYKWIAGKHRETLIQKDWRNRK